MIGAVIRIGMAVWCAAQTVPCAVFAVECLVGSLPDKKRPPRTRRAGKKATVLIPAHDESAGIGTTVRRVIAQIRHEDQVLVVADNCSDDTAEIARQAGADVLERNEPSQKGKGYALSYAVAHLGTGRVVPDVVVILDADCEMNPGGIDALIAAAEHVRRPVQADYSLRIVPGAEIRTKIGALAFRVKNLVRPRGLGRLGFGRQLAGTGMAFPWDILRSAPDMRGHITEDLVLGLELALRGEAPQHCFEAHVQSDIAPSLLGQSGQRQRWEHGHASAIRDYFPKMMREAFLGRRLELMALALDLAVPSLAMLVLTIGGTFLASTVLAVVIPGIGPVPAVVAGIDAMMVGCGVAVAWWRCGRDLLSARDLCLGVPRYVLWKVPSYLQLLRRRRTTEWVRAER